MNRKYIIASIICLVGFSLDQISKLIIRDVLAPRGRLDIISGFLDFRYAENSGMAFGLLQGFSPALRTPLFSMVTLVAVIIIIHLLRQSPAGSIRLPVALGFILSGAFGNLINRFQWGAVVDFIRVRLWPPANYYWPTFNLADSFITVGICLLVLDTLLVKEEDEEPEGEKGVGDEEDINIEEGEPGSEEKEKDGF